jgi:hypothetical protein
MRVNNPLSNILNSKVKVDCLRHMCLYPSELNGRELSRYLKVTHRSVHKAMRWLDKAECSFSPKTAEGFYRTGESYISDTIYKLNEQENNNHINISEDVNYCEKIKSETDVKIGHADNAKP